MARLHFAENRFSVTIGAGTLLASTSGRRDGDLLTPRTKCTIELLADPLGDVAASVPEVPAYSETRRAGSSIAPCVESCDRDLQVRAQLLRGHQPIKLVHALILWPDPVSAMPFRCQQACQPAPYVSRGCEPLFFSGRVVLPPKTWRFGGFGSCGLAGWRVIDRVGDTLVRGLCGLFRDMLCSTSLGYGRVPAGNGLVVADRCAPVASASNSNRTNAHTAPQTVEKFSSDLREPEPSEQIRTTTTATPDDHYQTDENTRSQVCLLATDRPIRHTHLQRVAGHRRRGLSC